MNGEPRYGGFWLRGWALLVDAALLAERVQGQAALTPGQVVVRIDPYYFRPSEVDNLWGDASKAMARLGWAPRTSLEGIVEEMMAHDLQLARGQMYLKGIDRA